MLNLYQWLTQHSAPALYYILKLRVTAGKEDSTRIHEREGRFERQRPSGPLYWFHAASVGEAQSALILIKSISELKPTVNILVTSGTLTSAEMLQKNLPPKAFHQFYPLDHPRWVNNFLDHWQPDLIIWMESELWPNMLVSIRQRSIPAVLVNARLSHASYSKWKKLPKTIKTLLEAFHIVLCQSEKEGCYFSDLGASKVHVSGNIKYSASPLPYDQKDFRELELSLSSRPCWLYASTHKGEEKIAIEIHQKLKNKFPDILTIIVPRHPARRKEIANELAPSNLNIVFRGPEKKTFDQYTDIYVADTMGELGLFYRLAPIAMIGRSLSDDGGGGHNPIEAAQLNCAVLHGSNVQNLQEIFDEMDHAEAAYELNNEQQVTNIIIELLSDHDLLLKKQKHALDFAASKTHLLNIIMDYIKPYLLEAEIGKGEL